MIQFPKGLKSKAMDTADVISSGTSASVLIMGDPCYGACDVRKDSADALIHSGHSAIPSLDDGGICSKAGQRRSAAAEDAERKIKGLRTDIVRSGHRIEKVLRTERTTHARTGTG